MLNGKKILIGITGSIAAYKIPLLVRLLIQAGAEVKVIMTPASASFVSPLTLSTLSRNRVLVDLFEESSWANHVELGRWADLMVIAPLSCNSLSKMAHGQCDSLLMAVYLSATCPVMAAPAMDEDMWHHLSTKTNISLLREHGCLLLDVGYGELASGLTGEGRMAEPAQIFEAIERQIGLRRDLIGKKALVTAGPTYEPIDPVRFIGNHSTGKMGFALADELVVRGAEVMVITGPVALQPKQGGISLLAVGTARAMYEACMKEAPYYDVAIMAAAVADYTPETVAETKIKKTEGELVLRLRKTDDILGSLGKIKKSNQKLIGFALETHNELEFAKEKLVRKNADLIVMNSLRQEGAGFGVDTNVVTVLTRDGGVKELGKRSKTQLARDIVDMIIQLP